MSILLSSKTHLYFCGVALAFPVTPHPLLWMWEERVMPRREALERNISTASTRFALENVFYEADELRWQRVRGCRLGPALPSTSARWPGDAEAGGGHLILPALGGKGTSPCCGVSGQNCSGLFHGEDTFFLSWPDTSKWWAGGSVGSTWLRTVCMSLQERMGGPELLAGFLP